MTAPRAPLPPPTDLELAAVRARVEVRNWLGAKGSRRWDRVARLAAQVLAAQAAAQDRALLDDHRLA